MSKKAPKPGITPPDSCFCTKPCKPMAQIVSHEGSYITVCERLEEKYGERDENDKYRVVFHNDVIHDEQHYDLRDLVDTASVLIQAASIAHNELNNSRT